MVPTALHNLSSLLAPSKASQNLLGPSLISLHVYGEAFSVAKQQIRYAMTADNIIIYN